MYQTPGTKQFTFHINLKVTCMLFTTVITQKLFAVRLDFNYFQLRKNRLYSLVSVYGSPTYTCNIQWFHMHGKVLSHTDCFAKFSYCHCTCLPCLHLHHVQWVWSLMVNPIYFLSVVTNGMKNVVSLLIFIQWLVSLHPQLFVDFGYWGSLLG